MSDSLFTSVNKTSGSLFPNTSNSSATRVSLFGTKSSDAPPTRSIFSRIGPPTNTSGNLFVAQTVSSQPSAPVNPTEDFRKPIQIDTLSRRRSLKITVPSPGVVGSSHRDPSTPSIHRRISASSQISKKYLRLQQAASVKNRHSSEEQEPDLSSPKATTDLSLANVPPAVNSRSILRRLLSQFGDVERTYCNKKKNTAIVHFATLGQAAEALEMIPTLPEFRDVAVFYSKRRSRKSSDHSSPPQPSLKRQPPQIASSIVTVQTKVPKLDGLQRLVAHSTNERFEILRQRDDLVRQSLGKSDLSKLPGTCTDMCPERERYARQDQHRLSIFEVVRGSHPSQVDHARAVKEYARSSADQPPPLPLEMRPLSVLTRTMNYLLAEVADRCKEPSGPEKISWSEWYDFLWNRTRAIRKEITQQRFCSVETALIVEQTARFHVFAAVRLRDLPVHEFDPKINDENLTKCLQTLKELYHDLESEPSPNEAEFRGYMILRNLNDPNIMNEVTKLAPHIRTSPAVRLAKAAYSDLSSNNYVHFFKLVRRATFLEAALLHRYFPQVRARALRVLVMSGKAGSISPFPLASLTSQLGFEDEEEALEFCAEHELGHEDGFVCFSRSAFRMTKDLPIGRSKLLIESKLGDKRIGEILMGGPVQTPFPLETPKSSFDADGRFIGPAMECLKLTMTTAETVRPLPTKAPESEEDEEEVVEEDEEEDEEEEEEFEDAEDFENDFQYDDDGDALGWEEYEGEEDGMLMFADDGEIEEGEIIDEYDPRKSVSSVVVKIQKPTSPSKASPDILHLCIQDIYEEMITEIIPSVLPTEVESVLQHLEIQHSIAVDLQEELIDLIIKDYLPQEVSAAVKNETAAVESAVQIVGENILTAWTRAECGAIAEAVVTETAVTQKLLTVEQSALYEALVSELVREVAMEVVVEERCTFVLKRRYFARWCHAQRLAVIRRDVMLHIPAGPPLEHSRLIADRLFGCGSNERGRPHLPDPLLTDGLPAHDRFARALERKQKRLFAPFVPADFPMPPSGPGEEPKCIVLLLGQPGVSMEIAEWTLAKLDRLEYIDPVIKTPEANFRLALSTERGRVAAVICLGCVPLSMHQKLPTLIVKDRVDAEDAEVSKRLTSARRLFFNCAESVRTSWTDALASGLTWCLSECANPKDAASADLPLTSLIERFLTRVFFEPLANFNDQLRLDQRLSPDVNRLIDFYASALTVLEEHSPADVSYRFLPLLKVEHFPKLVDNDWEAAVAVVLRYMSAQHFSGKCTAECSAAIDSARRRFREIAREYDLHGWVQPSASALPWGQLLLLWVEDRLAEVFRQCAAVLATCRANPAVLRRCLAAAAPRCRLPPASGTQSLSNALTPALASARDRKWRSFCDAFGAENRSAPSSKRRDQEWEELEEEMRQLRTSMKEQLENSLSTSQLFLA